jgi:GTPase SAR1 family protein
MQPRGGLLGSSGSVVAIWDGKAVRLCTASLVHHIYRDVGLDLKPSYSNRLLYSTCVCFLSHQLLCYSELLCDMSYHPGNRYNQNYDDDEPPYTDILQSVPLGTDEENCRLLDQVDKLRECGVDEYIDLPQIVVVGDQSSGKSSILEALTNIPFPRKSVKCTRFATQIRLRRAVQVRRIVRIQPHNDCTPTERVLLSTFEEEISDEHDFDTIFQRAMDAIFPKGGKNPRFLSRNTLSIEVSGPEQPHLTVVDLPGFIHSPSMDQTAEDIADIEALAKQYMKKERTIVLPVVSGDIEYSKQVVLRTIKELDPKGIRTLGIITKPDMTLTDLREKEFINLASNKDKKNKLQLGWHVLRNRTHEEMQFSPEQRKNAETEFFQNSNWSRELKADQLGIDALSKRLSTQLIRHIAAEVFKVEADIDRELERCREKLRDLGDGIDTTEEMESALHAWCERSARLTHAALEGNGVNPPGEDFFPSFDDGRLYARNFRSRVVKENYRFAEEMERWGSSCLIIEEDSQKGKSAARSGGVGSSLPEVKRSDYIKQEVVPLLRDNPGKELAMDSNPLLVYRLFQSYSSNWGKLAIQHIEAIHSLCEEFLAQVLDYAWPKRIESRIWAGFIKIKIESMRQNANDEMKRLLTDRMRLITPYESEFLRQWYERQDFDATDRGPISPEEQQYEHVWRKMLLMYQVSDLLWICTDSQSNITNPSPS